MCNLFIEKNEGCQWMICGTAAHGKLADALRNGGCGIAFEWTKLKVSESIQVYSGTTSVAQSGSVLGSGSRSGSGSGPGSGILTHANACARRLLMTRAVGQI